MDLLDAVLTSTTVASVIGQIAGVQTAAAQGWAALVSLLCAIGAGLLWVRWALPDWVRTTRVDWLVPGGTLLLIGASATFAAVAAGAAAGGAGAMGVVSVVAAALWKRRDLVITIARDFLRELRD